MLLINAPLIDLWENSLFTEKPERSEIPKLTGQVSLIYKLSTTCKQTYTVANRHFHPLIPCIAPRKLQLRLPTLLLLPRLILQHPPQNLARRTLGDLVYKQHSAPQPLVIRHLPIHPLDNLSRRSLVTLHARRRYDVRARRFCVLFFEIDTDDCDIVDILVVHQDALEFYPAKQIH